MLPRIGLLYSGGLDSAVLAGHLLSLGHRVQPMYVSLGLHWENFELGFAHRYLRAVANPRLDDLVILEMPARDLYGDHWSVTGINVPDASTRDEAVYLPGRNPLLMLKARMWCQLHGIQKLALGCSMCNPFADASDEFFAAFSKLLNQATDSFVEIVRPLAGFTKRQVMELGADLPLKLTFSCIDPVDGLHCGRCNKCEERRHAFRLGEMSDPTEYAKTVGLAK